MQKFPEAFLKNIRDLLGGEYPSFLNSLNAGEQKAIYVNNNKISCENLLNCVDFKTEPIPYEKSGFYIDNIKLGKHPLHHAGAFYVQDASAMFTVNALNFKGNELVLDMCASPGGKSIQIANRLPHGVLISNEIDKSRCKILYSNIERMGLKNVIITNEKPENLANFYQNTFDVVLVDAPCSGEGMFRRGEEYTREWNENLPAMCAERQIQILNEADKCLKQGGHLIYSTCTYEEIENEGTIRKFLNSHNYSLVKINADFSGGINMSQAIRLYPHKNRGEGQFVAVLVKNSANLNEKLQNFDNKRKILQKYQLKPCKLANEFLKTYTNLSLNSYTINDKVFYIPNLNLIKNGLNYFSFGVKLGAVENNIFKPDHYFFSAFGKNFTNFINFSPNSNEIQKYLRGETLDIDKPDGYGVVKVLNCPLGGYKMSAGKFKNLYPKGLRN